MIKSGKDDASLREQIPKYERTSTKRNSRVAEFQNNSPRDGFTKKKVLLFTWGSPNLCLKRNYENLNFPF